MINPTSIHALRNLTITVDYYNIDRSDVIAAPPRGFTLDQCYNDNNQEFCSLITRRATGDSVNSVGSIDLINAVNINGAVLKTDGLDVTANYRTSLDALGMDGSLSARIAYTHLFEYDFQPSITADPDPQAGEIGTAQDRFTANLALTEGPLRWSVTGTYISKSFEDDQFCASFGLDAECVSVGAEFYLDSQVNFKVTEEFEFYLGVDNLLDNKAPTLLNGTTFNVTGHDTASDVYDVFGRRFYTGVRMRF